MPRWNVVDHVDLDHQLRCPRIDCRAVFTASDLAVLDGDGTYFEYDAPINGIVQQVPAPACPTCQKEFPEDLVTRGHHHAFVSFVGPPAAGKTGLIRRIFRELVAEQRLREGYGLSAELWADQRKLWLERMRADNQKLAKMFKAEMHDPGKSEDPTQVGARLIWVFILRSISGTRPPIVLLLQDIDGESTKQNLLTSTMATTLVLTANHDAVGPDPDLYGFDDGARAASRAFRHQLIHWYPEGKPDVEGRSAVLMLTQADLYPRDCGLREIITDRPLTGLDDDIAAISEDSQKLGAWLLEQKAPMFLELAAWLHHHRELQIDITGVGGLGVLPASTTDEATYAVDERGTAEARSDDPAPTVLGAGRALDPIILTLHRLGYLETEEADQ